MPAQSDLLYPEITKVIEVLSSESIPARRKETLQPLVDYISSRVSQKLPLRINFICTHNSRRSHFSQVWAQAISYYFGLSDVFCYSGGTEATALFPQVVETLEKQGFRIYTLSEGDNPVYSIKYADNQHPIVGFSKRMDDPFNPTSDFAAIMTCDSASEACPFVPGAQKRIPITYDDPKAFDGTSQQAEKYLERSLQIAAEVFYVFSTAKSGIGEPTSF
jgi:arsenate reductase